MTLATTDPYDRSAVPDGGEHAVVIGGSMAGLLAARVLSDAFDRVTIIERDKVNSTPTFRRGVPQGNHVHVLLEAGRAILNDLFPGYSCDLSDGGAQILNMGTDIEFHEDGVFRAAPEDPLELNCASRPLIEHVTRTHTLDIDGIKMRDQCHVKEFLTNSTADEVQGVTISNEEHDHEELTAEVVVDATGRKSITPNWLESQGYERPTRDTVEINLAYATVHLNRPSDAERGIHAIQSPPQTRGGVALPEEGGRWVMTLFGVHGDHPPQTVEGLRDFAATLPVDNFTRLLDEYEVISDEVAFHPFPASLKNRYWELDDFPEGLVVCGDAIASLNPVYGQGISVIALQIMELHHALANGTDELGVRFFDRVASVVENAWALSVGADRRYEETPETPSVKEQLAHRYLDRMVQKAAYDRELAGVYADVMTLQYPLERLFKPRVMWRVLKPDVNPPNTSRTAAHDRFKL